MCPLRMKIEVYMSEQCGSYHQLRENLDRALSELHLKIDVAWHTVYYDDAVSRNIKGSPSLWIGGQDAFEGGNSPGIT
jgi:hypothetical protein